MDLRYCPRVRIVLVTRPGGSQEVIYEDVDRQRCERFCRAYNDVMAGTGFRARCKFHPLSKAIRAASVKSR